jgi:hypothetical protein
MVAKIPLVSPGGGDGGVYFLSPSKGDDIKKWKVGMSHNSILRRVNSYGICFTQVHVGCIIKVKRQTKNAKPSYARQIEKFLHDVLERLGHHQQYAPIGDRDGEHLNYVTRRR